MSDFASQTIVITGAASGIGLAIATYFAEIGAAVIAIDRDEAGLAALKSSVSGNLTTAPCDVSDLADVERVLGDVKADVLINAAGVAGTTNTVSYKVDPADIQRVFAINYFGCYYTSRVLLPGMAERGYGRVLHIASVAGKEGNAGMLGYSYSKAAVIGMTKVQGKEMAETGVTVNALAPAVIRTPMVDGLPEAQVTYMTDKIPMKRCGTLDEVVAMVAFIVSPQASFTTAFTFDMTGGRATY